MLYLVAQSCLTLCNPVNYRLTASPLQAPLCMGVLQARVGCHALLQGVFPTQGLNPGLPHRKQILHHLSHQGRSPWMAREVPTSRVLGAQCQEPKTKTKYMFLIWYSVFDNVECLSGIAGDFICNQAGPHTDTSLSRSQKLPINMTHSLQWNSQLQGGKEQSEPVTSQQRALDPGLCWHLAGICSIVTNYVIDKQMAILQQSPGFMLISPSASFLLSQVFSESASLTSQWS